MTRPLHPTLTALGTVFHALHRAEKDAVVQAGAGHDLPALRDALDEALIRARGALALRSTRERRIRRAKAAAHR